MNQEVLKTSGRKYLRSHPTQPSFRGITPTHESNGQRFLCRPGWHEDRRATPRSMITAVNCSIRNRLSKREKEDHHIRRTYQDLAKTINPHHRLCMLKHTKGPFSVIHVRLTSQRNKVRVAWGRAFHDLSTAVHVSSVKGYASRLSNREGNNTPRACQHTSSYH